MPGPSSITFADHALPPLQDDTYTLTLTHTLTYGSGAQQQTFVKAHTFAVTGERFQLPPQLVHKTFPPAHTQGDYDALLPHVLLGRRTLPWERNPGTSGDQASWLAVLVFAQAEAPAPQAGTLADLLPSSVSGNLPDDGSYWSYGSGSKSVQDFLDVGQQLSDACTWLDLPGPLWAAYAPSAADLQWNAHVRTRTHADGSGKDYAAVVANRLPPPGQTAIAHLVSLEGLGSQLPDGDGTLPNTPTWSTIRLVSLTSWSFRVGPLQASFTALLQGLNGGVQSDGTTQRRDSQLRLPDGYQPSAAPAQVTSPPFDAGYTVLQNESLAEGSAWYRGPLWPSTITPPAADATWTGNPLPVEHAGTLAAALPPGVAPATDQSYAAAWQLGRLLALADRDFATAQVAWKRDARLALDQAFRQQQTGPAGSRAAWAQSLRAVLDNAGQIQGYLGTALTTNASAAPGLAIPQKLVDWLGRLALLQGVPFEYLVPDAAMLPPESLRCFSIDPRWVACLLDGAWSLDREPVDVWAFDAAYQPWQQLLPGASNPLSPSFEGTGGTWPSFGILLNSRLLSGYWPGIDFATGNDAALLREDRLGPNTLLLLYDQPFQSLTIQEPPEGIHFGFAVDAQGDLSKPLRNLPGGDTPTSTPLPDVPQRSPGVVQLDSLATDMASQFPKLAAFTSAQFALQMVQGVPLVTFSLPGQAQDR